MPTFIKLSKMSKGYNWEIRVEGENDKEIIEKIERIDLMLIDKWGSDGES